MTFADRQSPSNASSREFEAITPSDATDLDQPTRAVYVGGAGSIAAVMPDGGSAVIFASIPAGSVLPIQVRRINATGTDATDLVALY
jgi:hypothetical protein